MSKMGGEGSIPQKAKGGFGYGSGTKQKDGEGLRRWTKAGDQQQAASKTQSGAGSANKQKMDETEPEFP